MKICCIVSIAIFYTPNQFPQTLIFSPLKANFLYENILWSISISISNYCLCLNWCITHHLYVIAFLPAVNTMWTNYLFFQHQRIYIYRPAINGIHKTLLIPHPILLLKKNITYFHKNSLNFCEFVDVCNAHIGMCDLQYLFP